MRSDPGVQALEHAAPAAAPAAAGPRSARELAGLTLGAVGVVYGDIGTSPLYAVRECFHPTHGVPPTPENVLGVLSLIFWALLLVIVVKYLTFVMRADNHGEGGILALLALVQGAGTPASPRRRGLVLILGLSGAALLYGDGMLTPAISVLSAVEGIGVATPGVAPAVVPLTLGVLVAVFLVQRRGTARIGAWFGPIAAVWFVCIAAAGIPWILREPGILAALSPTHAIGFLAAGHPQAWFVLGAVVLCITGGEALFADMGHFGRRPIVLAWYSVVFPALLLNYFGQGALLLREGTAPASPFYALVPASLLYPMVGIATLATVVASQAVISGAFSLTRQAVQLGFLPRMRIVHTSSRTEGQIYVPLVNTGLMLACVALVLGFRSSSGLAGAYGLAVIGVMTSTTLLYASVARARFGVLRAAALASLFLAVELAFLATNATKLVHGGWFPICIGLALLAIMVAWKTGYERLDRQLRAGTLPLDRFVVDVHETRPLRVPGIAVFLGGYPGSVPPALLHHFKHSKVLHEQVIVLSIVTEPVPVVPGPARVEVEDLGEGFAKVTAHYGFMQTPTIQEVLWRCAAAGLAVRVEQASFFLGRVTVLPSAGAGPLGWRQRLFGFLHQTAQSATVFFGIPPSRVVELGMQVRI